ncbi:MAG: hypothetical protein OXE58_06555 [Acidobacteria bacterium]|nr:hypothetical protein [Acidobacteriota bacterium]
MPTTRADEERRVTLPDATPGDLFDVRRPGNGDYLLVRVSSPAPKPPPSYAEVLEAILKNPVEMRLSWEELRRLTRDP